MQQTDMSNLIGIPSADYYETRLANMWNWTNGTVYVEKVPDGSMPISEYSYIVVNPWEVNMQVAKIDGWDSDNDTFNVIDVAIPSGAWTYYNAKNHPVGSVVRFSNNYAFWKDIQEAINGKLDITSLAPVAVSNDYNDLCNKPTIPTDNCELCNGCWYITWISCTDVTDALGYTPYDNTNPDWYTTCTWTLTSSDLACYTQFCDLPDVSWFVEESCIACINGCCLTEWWDITIQVAGGDMEACVYDPNNCATDAFDYCNMYNTPTIPTDNCELANSCGFTTCTWTLTSCDIANLAQCCDIPSISNLAQCCDIPTDNCQLGNGCWYTTCTWTVIASDLTPYAKTCDLAAVATSWKYCDLSGRVTDNCQIWNSCWYTTCTWTLVASDIQCLAQCCDIPTNNCELINWCWYIKWITCGDVTGALWYTPANSANLWTASTKNTWICCGDVPILWAGGKLDNSIIPSVAISDTFTVTNKADLTWLTSAEKWDVWIVTAENKTYILSADPYSTAANWKELLTPTDAVISVNWQTWAVCINIPTDNCQLSNGCGYTTCTWTVVAGDLAPYAKCCELWTVAFSNKYCDLSGQPTIPTDNCQLWNSCWYTTCTGTLTSADIAWLAQCCDLACKQDTLTAWNNISLVGNVISWDFNYAEPTTAAACTTKCVCIPEITQLCAWQTIIVKPTITATNCATNIKLNGFDAYPVRYNNAALTSTTDWYVRWANQLAQFVFDWSYWHVVWKSYDANTTYTMNYSVDAWKYTAWSGSYAISRYSLVLQKDDWTWETVKDTSTNYSTATTKTVNTHWFVLWKIRYYGTTTVVANGGLIAANVLYNKAASVDMRYSTNCWWTTDWAEWDFIYLVGTIWNDWLFYLDTTKRWSKTLPTTKDNKVYIRLWIALAAAWYTMSLLDDRPIFYYDNWLKIYQQADNKQDISNMVTTLTWADNNHYPTAKAVADAIQGAWAWDMLASTYDPCNCNTDAFDYCNMYNTPTIPTDNCQLANSCGYTTCTWTLSSCGDITTALWYTPYSAANPCGYTTCTGTVSSCSDIISKLWYTPYNSTNPCWYTTCTWTLTASDLTWYAKSCDLKAVATSWKYCDLTGTPTLCTVATSGKYCDLSWTPTIPTDNCQLSNGCGYTTCTGTLIPSNIACINGCCLTNGWNVCIESGWGGTVMCETSYDPWDYKQDFLYFTY